MLIRGGCQNLTHPNVLLSEAKSCEDKRKTSPYFNRKAARDGNNRRDQLVLKALLE